MKRTITVKGVGRVTARPDFVELSIALETKDKEYDLAIDKAASQMDQLKESLVSIGFEQTSLKTINFQVNADYEFHQDKLGHDKRVFMGFVCHHQLKLAFDFTMERLSETLEAVAKCLVQPELRISFTTKDTKALKEALLREATVNARKEAQILCEASGVKMGQLLSVAYNWEEQSPYSNTNYGLAQDLGEMKQARMTKTMDIEPDKIDVRDSVIFVWEID